MRHAIKQTTVIVFLALLVTGSFGQDAGGFLCQMIRLPSENEARRFVDLNNDGRLDLLAADPVANQLLIYRQHQWGFTNSADQIIDLPPHTAWISPYHVEAHKNFELLASTATGLVYYRQNDGVFEPKPRILVESSQVFTDTKSPGIISIATNKAIPVISTTQAILWHINEAGEWTAGPPLALTAIRNGWTTTRNGWTMGSGSSRGLSISRTFSSSTNSPDADKPENDGIAALLGKLNKEGPSAQKREVDLDGDGQKDLVVWQTLGRFDLKTDVYVFLRGSDGKLPNQPTQVLHCRGFPIPFGNRWSPTPVVDLRGDGKYELVLLEPKVMGISVSALIDTVLSHGVDTALTIRTFDHGEFSRTADASVPLTVILALYGTGNWPFFIAGDFNGDGRPDILVQRSSSQWDVYFSTTDGHWFERKPAMTFDIPTAGFFDRSYFEITDLNGDGRSDIALHDPDDQHIFIYLTQTTHIKGTP